MKLELLFILFIYVYYVLGEISSFIPKGQRAKIFEIMDNEVPTFRITLPEKEFVQLKRIASGIVSLDFLNNEIKSLIDLLNKQNLIEISEYNFSEEFPELSMDEDGYPIIDETKFLITYDEYLNLIHKYSNTYEILFNIYNDNTNLNLIKVSYMLYHNSKSSDIWKKLHNIFDCVVMDNDGNFFYIKDEYIRTINNIVRLLNELNFTELFPGIDFTELLPELPMKENGHPNIDTRKYIITKDDYEKYEKQNMDYDEIIFNILNNNDYLNLIDVINILYTLDSSVMNDNDRWDYIRDLFNSVVKDEDGNFFYIPEDYNREIKEIIDSINHQNFIELFPGYNFTKILPELPMKKNGYPNINFKKYVIPFDEYIKLENFYVYRDEVFFSIFNKNDYLNLINVFYTLSTLNESSKDDMEFWNNVDIYGNNASRDENGNFSYVNKEYITNIERIVNSLNEQDLFELFIGYNLKEILPELPLNENGNLNIDYQKYIISYEEYKMLYNKYNNYDEVLFNIFNKNDYLNLIKVFFTFYNFKDFYKLYKLNVSSKDEDDVWYNIYTFGSNVLISEGGNFSYVNKNYIKSIEKIVDSLNQENFIELFPGYDFEKLLPELPMDEYGYPEIEFQKYIPTYEEYQKLNEIYESENEILFNIFNNNEYLNLIKVFYTLSILIIPSDNINDDDIWNNIKSFGNSAMLDDNDGTFKYIKDENNLYIKDFVNRINQQNFNEIFPGYNFTEILPELPMNENGHPNIDYRKYIDIDPNRVNKNLDDFNSDSTKYLYNSFNTNKYLNLVKVLNTLSQLNISSSVESEDFMYFIKQFLDNINLNDYNNVKYEFSNLVSNNTYNNINNSFNFTNEEEKKIVHQKKYNEFKTKNGKMTVDINKQKLSFNKITFSIGGQSSRKFSKVNFNLKIRGEKELFGRRQFKLRGDASDPSYMRSKLMCDIHNKLGLPSLSANYVTLYINDEFMGLFILTDAYKESWIEYVYGEKDTKNLYKCDDCDLTYSTRSGFTNKNKEATNNQDLYEFLIDMSKAKSWTEVESIFDMDQFYKEIAIELLVDAWDHFNSGHNYYIYKNPQNNKWIYLLHDFDLDLGTEGNEFNSNISNDFTYLMENDVLRKLISNNVEHFNEILKEIVTKVFNPATLFPRIDEIKSFIRPYVQLDKTANEDGQYPGRINRKNKKFYTMEQWEVSTEFDVSMTGLKRFILLRYRDICQEYSMDCDPNYLLDNENIIINNDKNNNNNYNNNNNNNNNTATLRLFEPTETEMLSTTYETMAPVKCLSEFIGYPCCSSELTTIYVQDDYGDWSYDFNKNEWCGLTRYEDNSSQKGSEKIWSEKSGYPYSKKCFINETDFDKYWDYEFDQWFDNI